MIVARNGQIVPETGHDHDQRPECLNAKFRHNMTNRTMLDNRAAADDLSRLQNQPAPPADAANPGTKRPGQQQGPRTEAARPSLSSWHWARGRHELGLVGLDVGPVAGGVEDGEDLDRAAVGG